MSRSGEFPPGIHIHAVVATGSHSGTRARILGDDARGYLIAGISELIAASGEDFWFPTLDDALDCAERLDIPRGAWAQIQDVSQVPMP